MTSMLGAEHRRITLERALSRSLAVVTTLSVSAALLTVLLTGYVMMQGYAQHNLALVARQTAFSVEAALVFNDRTAAMDAIQAVADAEGLATVSIIRADGSELVRWAAPQDTAPGLVARLLRPDPIVAPIAADGHRVGEVRMQGNAAGAAPYLTAWAIGALGCVALTFLGARIVARRLRRTIVDPLLAIASVAHNVREHRSFDLRAPHTSIAEVDDLTHDFNALLDELQDWHSQLDRAHQVLLHRANYDLLSGLPNRSSFLERVDESIRSAQRSGSRFALLFLDGDRIKDINDRFGHAAGDKVIASIASRLTPVLRVGDMAARLGGDEFGVLIHNLESHDDALAAAGRIEAAMREPARIEDDRHIEVSLSIGIAIFPDDAQDVESLINIADRRMYEQKHAKRARL